MSHLLPLVSALRAEGCDAQILCLGAGGLAEAAGKRGLPHSILEMSNPWDPRIMVGLRRRLLSEGWDVVHAHGMRANIPIRACFPIRRGLPLAGRRPLLFTTVHSDLALDYASPMKAKAYLALDRMTSVAVDGYFCVCAYLADRLAARGIPRSRIHVVYSGIEQNPDYADLIDGVRSSVHAGYAGEGEVIGTVARLVDVKDIALLLEAARILGERRDRFRVIIVGDGPERTYLEGQASAAGLTGVVDFRGEVRPVWEALRDFHVYALTSVSEGIPLSIIEAMSVGLPIVATAVGGVPEVIDDGVSGHLVARNADRVAMAAALADRLDALLRDGTARAQMGRAAEERVLRDFSSAATARETMRVYERVDLARSGNGAF